ncbi:hypothetical protein ASF57_12100 [Methylobacterium sp. Leaf117]|nr:hypothetical protein ASF57_12100 [Methylobacterium sp. Leaf117]
MVSFASVYRDIHARIIIAVESGIIGQSSAEHILALKVAHEGEERLNERERRYYRGRVMPLLRDIFTF